MINKICFHLAMAGLVLALSSCGAGLNRFSALEEKEGGFALYRSGQPTDTDLEEWCSRGVIKIFALNGQAGLYQQKLSEKCPAAQVVYNEEQNPDVALSRRFLETFDHVIQDAQRNGERVLIHCYCGCHRTGRLAAYYRMRYQAWPANLAIREMMAIGKDMEEHPSLGSQIYAMDDFIHSRGCTRRQELCIR